MLTVDRAGFYHWRIGVLVSRVADGSYVAPNKLECQAAKVAMERGEAVLLRNGARLIGTEMVLRDGAYCEQHSDALIGMK